MTRVLQIVALLPEFFMMFKERMIRSFKSLKSEREKFFFSLLLQELSFKVAN